MSEEKLTSEGVRIFVSPNALDIAADIQNVRSGSVLAPLSGRAEDFVPSLVYRHISIEGTKGVIMNASLSLLDIAFLAESFAQMLQDDTLMLTKMNLRIAGEESTVDLLQERIGSAQKSLEAAAGQTKLLQTWTPTPEDLAKARGEADEAL